MNKTKTLTVIFLLTSLTAGTLLVELAKANPYWGWVPGVVPAEPSKDKPVVLIESPGNYSLCAEGNVTLNFTVVKPSSWNHTVLPFGDCANGHIRSVNVSLNGVEEFQDYLNADNLNGGSYWNKSYSLNIGGLRLGTNALSVTVFANAFYIENNSTDEAVSVYPMNITDILFLICGTSPTPSPSPSPSPTISPSPPPSPTKAPSTSVAEFPKWIILMLLIVASTAALAYKKGESER
jgi:hypothetical protein